MGLDLIFPSQPGQKEQVSCSIIQAAGRTRSAISVMGVWKISLMKICSSFRKAFLVALESGKVSRGLFKMIQAALGTYGLPSKRVLTSNWVGTKALFSPSLRPPIALSGIRGYFWPFL